MERRNKGDRVMVINLKNAIFASLLASSVAQADTYLVQKPDISVEFNMGVISRALNDLQGVGYEAIVDIGSPCGRQTLTFSLDQVLMALESRANLRSGSSVYNVDSGFKFSGGISNCAGVRASLRCDTQQSITGISNSLDLAGRCKWSLGALSFIRVGTVREAVSVALDKVLNFPESLHINLQDSNDFRVEFGEFKQGAWVPALNRHKKQIKFTTTAYGSMSSKVVRGGPITTFVDPQILRLNVNSGTTYYRPYENRDEAELVYDDYMKDNSSNWQNNHFFRFSVRDSFFSKITPEGDAGIFNDILPIRLTELDRNGNPKGHDIALKEAIVRYGELNGSPVIFVSFSIVGVSDEEYYQNSQATLIFSVPKLEQGRLKIELLDGKIKVEGLGSTGSGQVCLEKLLTDIFVDRFITLATSMSTIDVTVPECVDTGEPTITSRRNCPGGRLGKMNRIGNFSSTRIDLLHGQTRIEMTDDETLSVVIPYKETKY